MRTDSVNIYGYFTHYKIENYRLGMCPKLENTLSTYDEFSHKRNFYWYYDSDNMVLYVPRGVDPEFISSAMDRPIQNYIKQSNPYQKISFDMNYTPRDDTQKEAVRFLLGKNEHDYTARSSQVVLSLIGGGGKTYCSVAAMSILELKTIVVCHSDDIKRQWQARLQEYTNLESDSILFLNNSAQLTNYLESDKKDITKLISNTSVYLVTHSLLHSFISNQGFERTNQLFIKLGIGLKIIDEFHRNFMNTLLIDYATNVYKTFYLSATPGRSDDAENKVFQLSFNRVYKLKRTAEDMNREKNTIAIFNLFKSKLTHFDVSSMYNRKTFSVHKYTEYELSDGTIMDKIINWLDWLEPKTKKGQMIMVLSSMKTSCDQLSKLIEHVYPDKKVCAYYTGHKTANIQEYDVVCATVSMMGTGNDYQNLKAIINTEAFGSPVTADQLCHRLMRGNTDIGTTYYIDLIDKVVPNAVQLGRKRRNVISQFVAKMINMDETIKVRRK